MSRVLRQALVVGAMAALTAACASTPPPQVTVPPTAGIYKVGKPYEIAGTWYYPREQPNYDKTGIASWYGAAFDGKLTADGEIFNPKGLTAAHRTLPLPVNVRVTNLENGRSLVLRVNDRGPFVKGRIIDVSRQAAKLLGFYRHGTARVRVTYLDVADLPNGHPQGPQTPVEVATALPAVPSGAVQVQGLSPVTGAAVAPPTAVDPLPHPASSGELASLDSGQQPNGVVGHVAVPAVTHLYVQAGAFISYDDARRIKARLNAAGRLNISSIDRNGMRLYRVRMGPFNTVAEADAALARINNLGGSDARIVVDR